MKINVLNILPLKEKIQLMTLFWVTVRQQMTKMANTYRVMIRKNRLLVQNSLEACVQLMILYAI